MNKIRTTIYMEENLWKDVKVKLVGDRRSLSDLASEKFEEWLMFKDQLSPEPAPLVAKGGSDEPPLGFYL